MKDRYVFILKSIKSNLKIWIKFSLGKKEHVAGNRFITSNSDEVIETIDEVFSAYKLFGDIDENQLSGKKILEVGPGDSFGLSLRLLFSGSKEIICFDKFYAKRNMNLLKEAYEKMFQTQSVFSFDEILNERLIPKKNIHYIFGKGIEKIKIGSEKFEKESYGFIFSNQVIQEIYDPFPALRKMLRLLEKGGKMVHYIDFEPYNYFRSQLDKEYDFLTFPEHLYKWMVNKRGMGNRKRITDYINFLDSIDTITYKFLVKTTFLEKKQLLSPIEYPNFDNDTKEFYKELVEGQRSNFDRKFKKLPIEDFIVGNAYLIIEKNG